MFLQPVAYDPATAPPLPEPRQPTPQDVRTSILYPPEPERLPPPPPQKILLGREEMPQAPKPIPQHSYDDRQRKDSQMSPQNSHDAGDRLYQWHNQDQQPTIPVPHFTNFDVESALPPAKPQPELPLRPPQPLPQSTPVFQSDGFNRNWAGEVLPKSLISSEGPSDADRCVPTSKPWEPQAAYLQSPEQQHAIFDPPDKRSISVTDLSVNSAGVPTSGSRQTSDTYREIENRVDRGRAEQQHDDSFYWHSGRSSSDAEEDDDQSDSPTATPGDDSVGQRMSTTTSVGLQREHQDLPARSTSLSPKTSATYGASALGFGGPSDWEYFGDYEAEEVDDEELYSRPRPRDSKSVVEGSLELPVDSPLESVKPQSESVSPGSDLMRLENPTSHEATLAKPPWERSSQENMVQELRVSGRDDSETNPRSPSMHDKVTLRAASGQAALSSDTHGQQRPDLDDIIRAWSEAPCVGKVHEELPNTGIPPNSYEDLTNIAEASLASTPRERMLGVDVILKCAPSLPKLPDFVDFLNPNEHGLQQDADALAVLSDAALPTTECRPQMHPPSHQQEPTTNDMSANGEIKPNKEENHNLESEKITQSGLPPVGTVASSGLSLSISAEPSVNRMPLHIDSSLDKYTGSRAYGLSQASREPVQTDSDAKFQSSSQRNVPELDQQMLQNILQERLELENQEDCRTNFQKGKSELLQESRGTTSNEPIIMAASKTTMNLSQDQPSEQSIASPDTAQEGPHQFTPRSSSQENFNAENSIKPTQGQSQEHMKTPNTHPTSDSSSSTDNVTSESPPATLPPFISGASLSRHPVSLETGTVQDPYSDLDPWGKSSLNRFAAMLREESRAETNQDKLNIFNVFASRESRLRVILYGTDDELIIPQKPLQQKLEITKKPEKGGFVKQAVERANSIGLEHSLKALPALPANRESVIGLSRNALAPLLIQHDSTSKGSDVDLKARPSGDDSRSKDEIEIAGGPSGDDSYVMVDSPLDEVQRSPGGRSVVARSLKTGPGVDAALPQNPRSAFEKDSAASSKKPGSAEREDSPSSNRPIAIRLVDSGAPKKPAHTLLKYNEGRSEVKNYLANRKSVCRPYATLTQGSLESASSFGREEDINLTEAASVLTAPISRNRSSSHCKVVEAIEAATTVKQQAPGGEGPIELRRFVKADFDPLLLVLPKSGALIHESARILDLRSVMEAVPDDFSFIHQSVVAWDVKTKKQREDNDRQRYARQVESEQKIDSLFDDHEIGYGDIAELEIEFKRSEAAKRADEDRSEYQTFVSEVFNLVWTRLHYELDQLNPHYDQNSKLMDHTLAGKDMFEDSEEGLALGPTMSSFLALHQKLEIRYQKAFEAVLERDRRLKKTEISPWYTLSNIAKVKQLEKQFEDAEKKAIIEYCQQRDARANHLMDVLDQNTLRGVGANQDYMEAIMKAVRRIASGRAFASVPGSNEPTAGLEEVEKAKAITALLASSSEQIVQTFHVADMLLNSADYEVSVAKAKVAKADMATLAKLKEERAKEDQKLMRDLEHRLALIREDSRRTNDEIVKLMLFLFRNGRADSAPAQEESAHPNHEARIRRVLEEAKMRNALKE